MIRIESLNQQTPDNSMLLKEVVQGRLESLDIVPNENLGQHFLIDYNAISLLAHSVSPGNKVIEIGAGIGQLTEALAKKATKVVAIEIDRRYAPVLSELMETNPNLDVIYADALALSLKDLTKHEEGSGFQIIASIPYHITEPLLRKVADLDIESATMVVGRKLAESIQAQNEDSLGFGKLTLLAQSFFDIDVLAELGRDSFLPPPRTESSIIRLSPKEGFPNMRDFLLRKLFLTSSKSPLVRNCMKEGLTEFTEQQNLGTRTKKERSKIIRRSANFDLKQAAREYNEFGRIEVNDDRSNSRARLLRVGERAIIDGFGIPSDILGKPFDKLNNSELRTLSLALRGKDR
ncbi:MAG: hypothetical protein E6Q58_03305 [Niabella sp.]|nr:MAG: hypothetical protein E6Q58_03305 [Niabella sp.]